MGKKLEHLMGLTAEIKPSKEDSPASSKIKTAAGQSMAFAIQRDQALDQLDQAIERAEKAEAELQVARQGLYLDVEHLHEKPGRRRKLSEQEYQDLKENLKTNDLVQAVTVRPRREGGYEVISGNNRVAIYKELGKPKILAVIQSMDDDKADLSGFYANLLQPSLPDFEKYQGFKMRQQATGKTQKELAEEAGVPETTVSKIYSFDKLPAAAKAQLAIKPQVLGANAAAKIVLAMENGKEGRAVEAIAKLVSDDSFTQNQAVAFVVAGDTPAKVSAKPLVINDGKRKYCELKYANGNIGIHFTDASETEIWVKKIEAYIRAEMKAQN